VQQQAHCLCQLLRCLRRSYCRQLHCCLLPQTRQRQQHHPLRHPQRRSLPGQVWHCCLAPLRWQLLLVLLVLPLVLWGIQS
jgi:hypothetical protein